MIEIVSGIDVLLYSNWDWLASGVNGCHESHLDIDD
jgi:hypothetical protein